MQQVYLVFQRLSYLGSIILITYIHKVKPIAKMGNAVKNEHFTEEQDTWPSVKTYNLNFNSGQSMHCFSIKTFYIKPLQERLYNR